MWRSVPSVCPSLYDLLSAILMQFGIELFYYELSSIPEFRENRFVDSGTLLGGVIERLLLLSVFFDSLVYSSV
jgi:hypothetical protein